MKYYLLLPLFFSIALHAAPIENNTSSNTGKKMTPEELLKELQRTSGKTGGSDQISISEEQKKQIQSELSLNDTEAQKIQSQDRKKEADVVYKGKVANKLLLVLKNKLDLMQSETTKLDILGRIDDQIIVDYDEYTQTVNAFWQSQQKINDLKVAVNELELLTKKTNLYTASYIQKRIDDIENKFLQNNTVQTTTVATTLTGKQRTLALTKEFISKLPFNAVIVGDTIMIKGK